MDFQGKLADLKEKLRVESLVKSADDLKVGTIIYMEMDKNDGLVLKKGFPTRRKYVVVAGRKSDRKEVCVVLINSDADYSNAQDWKDEQYLLLRRNYPDILDDDSWLDCTDPKILTIRKIKAKKAEVRGRLTADDLMAMMTKLKNSDFIDLHTKRVFGISAYDAED